MHRSVLVRMLAVVFAAKSTILFQPVKSDFKSDQRGKYSFSKVHLFTWIFFFCSKFHYTKDNNNTPTSAKNAQLQRIPINDDPITIVDCFTMQLKLDAFFFFPLSLSLSFPHRNVVNCVQGLANWISCQYTVLDFSREIYVYVSSNSERIVNTLRIDFMSALKHILHGKRRAKRKLGRMEWCLNIHKLLCVRSGIDLHKCSYSLTGRYGRSSEYNRCLFEHFRTMAATKKCSPASCHFDMQVWFGQREYLAENGIFDG